MSTPPMATGDDSVVEVLKKALERAEEPVTAKQLREQLTGPYKLAVDKLEQILMEQVSLGSAFRFEPYKGKSPRYWSRNLDQYARAAMLKRLSKRPETSGDLLRGLKSPLKGYSPDRLRQLLRELVEGGHARELPTFVRSRTKRFSTNSPDPRDYLRDALEDIYKKLGKAGITRERVDAAALELLEHALPAEAPKPEAPPPEPPREGIGGMILERMVSIWPEAANGALVSLRDLRSALESQITDKPAFDAAVIALAEEGRVALHRHDYPSSLSADERAGMVPDGRGSYYIGIALRG